MKQKKRIYKTSASYIHKNLKDFTNEINKAQKHLSKNDKILNVILKKAGNCKIKPHKNYFETLVESIISQQLSVKASDTIYKRFKALFGNRKYFPAPKEIISMPDERMRACGMSYPKVSYVKDLAAKIIDGSVKIHKMGKLPDEEVINELIQVKGIGIWSAHMFLIFCLGRLNVLPVGDLGFRNSVKINYNLRKSPDEKKIYSIAKKNKWEPYCSVATWYQWASLNL